VKPELLKEIKRLEEIFESNGLDFVPRDGARAELIAEVESSIGLTFDANLKDLWTFANGSGDPWFAVFSDELTPCAFSSVEAALECWSWDLPYDDTTYGEWNIAQLGRDERIQPNYLRHRRWFPFAEFNGFSTSIIFDADPTEIGTYGQIIVYQHDPDAIYYVAQDVLSFFKSSNDLLEINARELFLD
jgi:cell wall assembly regulator SMI1